MISSLLFAALLSVPASAAKEKDDYAPLKGLYGRWDVARDCGVMKDKIYVEIFRMRNAVRAMYFESPAKKNSFGRSDVFWNANAERYKIFTYIPQVTQLLGVQAIPGSLAVSGPDTEEPGLITVNAHYSVVDGNMRLKLKDKNTQATFTLRGKSPLGTMNCTGAGVKLPGKATGAPVVEAAPGASAAPAAPDGQSGRRPATAND